MKNFVVLNWRPSHSSTVPPFEQLRTAIASAIQSGELAQGSKLPPVRALAAATGLAANTVARAFRELEQASLLRTEGCRGTYVNGTPDQAHTEVLKAAAAFADVVHDQGLSPREALAIAKAAIEARK